MGHLAAPPSIIGHVGVCLIGVEEEWQRDVVAYKLTEIQIELLWGVTQHDLAALRGTQLAPELHSVAKVALEGLARGEMSWSTPHANAPTHGRPVVVGPLVLGPTVDGLRPALRAPCHASLARDETGTRWTHERERVGGFLLILWCPKE